MTATPAELHAMTRALHLAATADLPPGPNPRVACLLLDADGVTLAEGTHRGAGTPHAEVDALSRAGSLATGATAVVTLEPCNHTGRTGPCVEALVEAGVIRVVFAQLDPNPTAAGGAAALRAAGVEVVAGVYAAEAAALNHAWTYAVTHGRPYVTWKFATTLDGRSAAADGTSRWVSSPAARHDTHLLRAACDAILVGTGTVMTDNPQLSARARDGSLHPYQPLRVVMGERDLPPASRVLDVTAPTLHLRTRDPHVALAGLHDREIRHLLLEGGPTLAAAFIRARLVDEVVAYVAPTLLGSGLSAVGDLAIPTMDAALRLEIADVTVIPAIQGDEHPSNATNLRLTLRPRYAREKS